MENLYPEAGNETKKPTITASIKHYTKAPNRSIMAIKKECNNCALTKKKVNCHKMS